MEVIPLSEGAYTIDQTKQFIPFEKGRDELAVRAPGSLLVEIQPFVLITAADIILLDTGLGFLENDRLQLHENLLRHHLTPDRVTKVLLSHLHKDHAGGIATGKHPDRVLAFPRATYFVQRSELALALQGGSASYSAESLAVLQGHPQVHLLEGNGVIDGYIRYQLTGAHSPYHQVFWINDGGKNVFFGADEAPQLQQMKTRFTAKYDYNGKQSMALRQEWWERGQQEKWMFLFYHDIRTPLVSFAE